MTCQFCDEDGHDDNSYMLRPDLWEKVIGKPYHYGSGWACLGCVAERLFPYQLRNEDFTDGPGDDDEPHKLNPRIIETFDDKYCYKNCYRLIFRMKAATQFSSLPRNGLIGGMRTYWRRWNTSVSTGFGITAAPIN